MSDDAARQNWGGKWRMPMDAEWTELREKCTWTWTTRGGHNGYKVTSKQNGNSIFLPAAGHMGGTYLFSLHYYWSSSLYTDYADFPCYVWSVGFDSSGSDVGRHHLNRCSGFPVRPVSE